MCNLCHCNPCRPTCVRVLKGKRGKDGKKGNAGKNSYTYIAYASNVVAGDPDVVTDFSLTLPQCWMAIITSLVALTPVEADFQDHWVKTCGSCDCEGDGISDTPNQNVSDVPVQAGLISLSLAGGADYLCFFEATVLLAATSLGTYKFRLDGVDKGQIRDYGPKIGSSNPLVWEKLGCNEKISVPAGPNQTLEVWIINTNNDLLLRSASLMVVKA